MMIEYINIYLPRGFIIQENTASNHFHPKICKFCSNCYVIFIRKAFELMGFEQTNVAANLVTNCIHSQP